LERRARLDRKGEDERKALKPLIDAIEQGRSSADRLLEAYHGAWHGDIDRIFDTQSL
jgi:glutamate--cysteine ligase